MEREYVFKSTAHLLFGENFEVKAKAYTEGLRALSTASSFKQIFGNTVHCTTRDEVVVTSDRMGDISLT